MSACLSVCLFVRISQKPDVQILPIFLYMLIVTVARPSSDGSAIHYILPVSWMTSRFQLMERMGQNQRQGVSMFRPVRQVAAPGASLSSSTASCTSVGLT